MKGKWTPFTALGAAAPAAFAAGTLATAGETVITMAARANAQSKVVIGRLAAGFAFVPIIVNTLLCL
jgi:hypothetical protein